MLRYLAVLMIVAIAVCNTGTGQAAEDNALALTVRWQRLVDETGQTCERCGATETEVRRATAALAAALGTLGIGVVAEAEELDLAQAAADISQSNRIWLNGRALEEWLGASVGMSACGSCCEALGDSVECRTLSVDGQTYEAIPAVLIIRAGLIAAADLLAVPADAAGCTDCSGCSFAAEGCCPPAEETTEEPEEK